MVNVRSGRGVVCANEDSSSDKTGTHPDSAAAAAAAVANCISVTYVSDGQAVRRKQSTYKTTISS